MNHRVVLLEKKEGSGERICCTGIISQQCVNDFSIDKSVILRWLKSAKLFSPSGRVIRLHRHHNQACVIDRRLFDEMMIHRAIKAGADFKPGCSVERIAISNDKVTVEAVTTGQKLTFTARVVVVAAGFNPDLINSLGLGSLKHFAIGAQTEVEAHGLEEVEIHFGEVIAPNFFAWLVPLSTTRARLGLLARHQPQIYLKNFAMRLAAEGKINSGDYNIESRRIPLRPLPHSYTNRLLLLGDSAGQVKATTGGGIYYGLLCADIAANNLHWALQKDDLKASSLANYESEWKELLGQDMRLSWLTRRFYEHLGDRQIDKIFNIIEKSGLVEDMLKEEDLTFDWHGRVILSMARRKLLASINQVSKMPLHIGGK
jgi:geranylgeranyl reductase family protein